MTAAKNKQREDKRKKWQRRFAERNTASTSQTDDSQSGKAGTSTMEEKTGAKHFNLRKKTGLQPGTSNDVKFKRPGGAEYNTS